MRRLWQKTDPKDALDMTPMVDVTFLLLIFFMVTASFSLQKSIAMPNQQSESPSRNHEELTPEEVTLRVDEYGSFLLLTPQWDMETPAKQRLVDGLRTALVESSAQTSLQIEVHELARLGSLVDAMDAGTIAGFEDLRVRQFDGI